MQITLEIPDTTAEQLVAAGQEPARAALVGLALEGYRSGYFSESDLRRLLGFESRFEVWDLLGEHQVPRQYSMEDWEHDKRVADENFAARNRVHQAKTDAAQ